MRSVRAHVAGRGHDAGQQLAPYREVPLLVDSRRLLGVQVLECATSRRDLRQRGVVENVPGIDTRGVIGRRPHFKIRQAVVHGNTRARHHSRQRLVAYEVLNRITVRYPAAHKVVPRAQGCLGVVDAPASAQHQWPHAIAQPVGESNARLEVKPFAVDQARWKTGLLRGLEFHADAGASDVLQ